MCAEKIMSMGNWFISDDVQWPQGFFILKKYHLKRHTLINKVKSLYFFIFRNLWFKKSWTLLKVLTLHIFSFQLQSIPEPSTMNFAVLTTNFISAGINFPLSAFLKHSHTFICFSEILKNILCRENTFYCKLWRHKTSKIFRRNYVRKEASALT